MFNPRQHHHQFDYVTSIPAWNEASFITDTTNAAIEFMPQLDYVGQLTVIDNNSIDNK